MTETLTLYRHPLSGHAHRVELMLSLLSLPYKTIDIDLAAGEQRSASFLAKNLFGQVPVLVDQEKTIADSNAILVYLASRYGDGYWYPEDLMARVEIQRWFSAAAGLLAFGPARARVAVVFGMAVNKEDAFALSKRLLDVMEQHLSERAFLATDHITVADVSLYTYVAHAPEGHVDLSPYKHVQAWLKRVEAQPGFVAMQATDVALAP